MINREEWMAFTEEQREHRNLIDALESYLDIHRDDLHEMDDEALYDLEVQLHRSKSSIS